MSGVTFSINSRRQHEGYSENDPSLVENVRSSSADMVKGAEKYLRLNLGYNLSSPLIQVMVKALFLGKSKKVVLSLFCFFIPALFLFLLLQISHYFIMYMQEFYILIFFFSGQLIFLS